MKNFKHAISALSLLTVFTFGYINASAGITMTGGLQDGGCGGTTRTDNGITMTGGFMGITMTGGFTDIIIQAITGVDTVPDEGTVNCGITILG